MASGGEAGDRPEKSLIRGQQLLVVGQGLCIDQGFGLANRLAVEASDSRCQLIDEVIELIIR